MKHKPWNRCDKCGRFIAIDDFGKGAIRRLIEPDSDRSRETYETLCKRDAELIFTMPNNCNKSTRYSRNSST